MTTRSVKGEERDTTKDSTGGKRRNFKRQKKKESGRYIMCSPKANRAMSVRGIQEIKGKKRKMRGKDKSRDIQDEEERDSGGWRVKPVGTNSD